MTAYHLMNQRTLGFDIGLIASAYPDSISPDDFEKQSTGSF